MSAEEKKKFEPSLEVIEEANKELQEPESKRSRTMKQYENHQDVLPSAKVCANYKHLKAMQEEIEATRALADAVDDTKITLHFNTTSQSRLDGEWPALIFNFLNDDKSKCQMYHLRVLFFAYEDRIQIKKLVIEMQPIVRPLNLSCGKKSLLS